MKLVVALFITLGLRAAEQALLSSVKTRLLGLLLDFSRLQSEECLDWQYKYRAEDNKEILGWKFWMIGTNKQSIRINEGDTLGKIVVVAIFRSGTSRDLELALSRGLVLDEENCGRLVFLLCTETDEGRKTNLLSLILSNKQNHSFVHIRCPLGVTNLKTLVLSPGFYLTSRYTDLIRAGADILASEGVIPFHSAFQTVLKSYCRYRIMVTDLLMIALLFGRSYSVEEMMRMAEGPEKLDLRYSPIYLKELIGNLFEIRQDLDRSFLIWLVLPEALVALGEDCIELIRHNFVLHFRHIISDIDLQAQFAPYG